MKTRRKAITKTLGSLMVVALIFGMFTMIRTDVKAATLNESEFKVGTIFKVGDNVVVTSTKVCFYPDPNERGGAHLPADTYTVGRGNVTFNDDGSVNTYDQDGMGSAFVILHGAYVCGAMKATLTEGENPDGKVIDNPDGIEILKIDMCSEDNDGKTYKRFIIRPHQADTVSNIDFTSSSSTLEFGKTTTLNVSVLPTSLAATAAIKWSASPAGIVKLYKDEACTEEVGASETGLTAVYLKGVGIGEATITAKSDDSIGRESTFKVTVSKPLIPDSEISAAQRPTAKTGEGTEYTGKPITLVNEPTESLPEGYKIKYALTTTETEPAESAYSDTIPTATEPGIYYIWYIIYRDKDGAETKPARLETEIVQPIDADEELHAVFGENLKIKQTRKAIKVSWGKSKNIDKFEVFIAYLGKKAGSTPTATTTANSVSVTKINNKKIDTKKNFSVEVVAYDKKGNKVGTSMKCFIAGKDNPTYTNVKSIKPAKKKITLKKGKKATINATLKLQSSSKKQLPKKYAPDIRYSSSNKKVATVNKKGKITAKGVGKCKIYMYAKNGVAKSITVTVKAK
ncbi:Ig-like domain-containing protein [Butyrivibrio sp. MB2005]|uniref:Ig-like domain-containing protein n=1 Tax=Butyrivibrio sp. MB2005 TaxID=1280678 RepID=UPI00041420E8|nr:Ig-like domain-containing protein [Butyrivibrio sp. MB2005]